MMPRERPSLVIVDSIVAPSAVSRQLYAGGAELYIAVNRYTRCGGSFAGVQKGPLWRIGGLTAMCTQCQSAV